jgi:tetrahydromethanopterin S-methyltransferase subunit E
MLLLGVRLRYSPLNARKERAGQCLPSGLTGLTSRIHSIFCMTKLARSPATALSVCMSACLHVCLFVSSLLSHALSRAATLDRVTYCDTITKLLGQFVGI